jgi:hypothetical protein
MTEQDELNTLSIEELRCGIALQLKTIERLRIERDAIRTRVQELEESLNDELLLRMDALVRVKELEAAAKLALDALKFAHNACSDDWVEDEKIMPAIEALRKALK